MPVDSGTYPVGGGGNAAGIGYLLVVAAWDDNDWTGEPPEGRHAASRADPGFWRRQRAPLSITATGIGIALIILFLAWLF
jgi:hypothetical protein